MAEFDFWVAVGIKAAQETLRQSRNAKNAQALVEWNNKQVEMSGVDTDIEYSVPLSDEGKTKEIWNRIDQFRRDNPHIVAVDDQKLWQDNMEDREVSYIGNRSVTKTLRNRHTEAICNMVGCLMVTYGRRTMISHNRALVSWTPDQIYHSEDEVRLDDIPGLRDASRVPRKNYGKF